MANLRALIVDEDLDSRVSTKRALPRADLDLVGEAGYGTEAVSLALQAQPDVIFLAIEEPAARALDTAEALANALPDTPVVAYSADASAEGVRRAMIAGARDYVLKPVEWQRLSEAVRVAFLTEERRQMRRTGLATGTAAGRGMVITVAGAKGGIGKSVLSVNLAVSLRAETNRSVVIIDADTQFGDVATMLDVTPERSVRDLLARRSEVDRSTVREFVTSHVPTGLDVLAASEEEGVWDDCAPEDVRGLIDLFAQVYDFVVIDTSGSMDRLVHACIDAATLTLMISSAEVSAVRDTAAAVRRLGKWGIDPERVRFVLNARTAEQGIGTDELSEAIGRPIFWTVPHDRAVSDAVQVGYPVVLRGAETRAGQSIVSLAKRISGRQSEAPDSTRQGLWRRIIPLRANGSRGVETHDPDMEQFNQAIRQQR